jgi:hypothetical protein
MDEFMVVRTQNAS